MKVLDPAILQYLYIVQCIRYVRRAFVPLEIEIEILGAVVSAFLNTKF